MNHQIESIWLTHLIAYTLTKCKNHNQTLKQMKLLFKTDHLLSPRYKPVIKLSKTNHFQNLKTSININQIEHIIKQHTSEKCMATFCTLNILSVCYILTLLCHKIVLAKPQNNTSSTKL